MGPKAWTLRPRGASLVGALAFACLLLPGIVHAAAGVPILQPDAPPSAAVVVPTPDPPAAVTRSPVVVGAATVPRPTLRPSAVATSAPPAAVESRPKQATPARKHTSSAARPKRTVTSKVLHPARLPDSVAAFLAIPVTVAEEGGLDRTAVALAGMLLAVVALGGGCMTVAVAKVARER
jgi:hypothetical protein